MFELTEYALDVKTVLRNASPATLYQDSLRYEKGATLSDRGALIACTGDKTGRSPKDKRNAREKRPPYSCKTSIPRQEGDILGTRLVIVRFTDKPAAL